MKNTNRDDVTKSCEYDLLLQIQTAINHGETCVLSIFPNPPKECIHQCDQCIQRWLNQKH